MKGNSLDIVFVVDVTGSMTRVLDSVKKHIDEILEQMYSTHQNVRVGFVQFRDMTDDFFVKPSAYMSNRYDIKKLVYSLYADGGGDLPEPILDALDTALTSFQFDADNKMIFVLTDAPEKKSIFTNEELVMSKIGSKNIDLQYLVLPVMK